MARKRIIFFLLLAFFIKYINAQDKLIENEYITLYYPNGKVLSEGYMKNGKPEGYWKTYFTTGILKSEGNRSNFLLDSVWIFYNSVGDTTQKINYLYGKKNGYSYEYNTDRTQPDFVGKILSKELFVNDIKEGKSFYYYKEGKLNIEVVYRNNKKDGISIEYEKDGRVITIIRYNKGSIVEREKINRYNDENKKDGTWKEFYNELKVKREENYKNGLLNGYYKEYDMQGKLVITLLYDEGKLIKEIADENSKLKVVEKLDSKGRVIESGPVIDSICVGIHNEFDTNGIIVKTRIFDNRGILLSTGIIDKEGYREGYWKDLYSSGNVKNEGNYINNLKEGKWVYYFENGKIEQTGNFKNGKEYGIWKWYFNNGNIWKEEEFLNGKMDGKYVEYDILQNVIVDGNFIEGEKEGDWSTKINDYSAKGKYVSDLRDGVWKYYYDDNSIMFVGEFIQGNPEGGHKYYYPDGKIKEEQYFVNGIPDKNWKKYDEEGNIIVTISYENGQEYRINGVRIDFAKDNKVIIK
jgi:antitoxin component YwqK of YwqJK toxin-antitoxin module